ncbi:MAG: alcohol dehydrogenase catalytic domain-containing protein [Acidobacteria bacterium]|nr:alcohol dehydrogenase catalytic domain-containing protein [Acidobacteriota bacterium]
MKALRFEQGRLALVRGLPRPVQQGEALIRVTMAGICNTDLEIVRGYGGFTGTLGHEFVGVVEESPEASQVGVRVVGEINAGCGRCACCKAGDARHCPERTVLGIVSRDGAFADYLSLPPANLLAVPDEIPDHIAVFAEPLAAASEVLEQTGIGSGQEVLILGDGKLGQLIARVLLAAGCRVRLIGKHAGKMKVAEDAGIETVPLETARNWLPCAADFVVEASGSPSGLQLALDLVRPRGTIVLKSTFHDKAQLDTSRIVVNEISVIGSRCGRFRNALDLLSRGVLNLEGMISAQYPLDRGIEAIECASEPEALKVLLIP